MSMHSGFVSSGRLFAGGNTLASRVRQDREAVGPRPRELPRYGFLMFFSLSRLLA